MSSFSGFLHPITQLTVNLVGITPGDSIVVIGYQLDKFTWTWLAECFVA